MGQLGDRLKADRARLAGLKGFGERVGGVGLLRGLPFGARLLGLPLRRLKFQGERVLPRQPGGQLLFLSLQLEAKRSLELVGPGERLDGALVGQGTARSFGFGFGLVRLVGELLAGDDPRGGLGDPLGETRDPGRDADRRQQVSLLARFVRLLLHLPGLLGALAQGQQPGVHGLAEALELPDAAGGSFLGGLGGPGELVTFALRRLRPVGGQARAVPRSLPDLLVHAEGQQLDQEILALARLGLQEVGEPALGQQHRLGEVLVGEPQDVLHGGLDRVRALGEVIDAGGEEVGQRRVGRDGRVEQIQPGLLGVHLAPLVTGQGPHRGVALAAGLEHQADPAGGGRGGQRLGDGVFLAPPRHGAVQREAQAVDQRALAGPGRAGQREEVDVGEVGLGRLAVAAETVKEQPQRSHHASPVAAGAGSLVTSSSSSANIAVRRGSSMFCSVR